MEKFSHMVAALGGPPDMADDWHTHLPKAPVVKPVLASAAGHIAAINGEALGLAVVALGGGRRVETDKINPSVGFTDMIGLGQAVAKGDPLCMVHAASDGDAAAAMASVQAAITIGKAVTLGPLIIERIT
jgi:thymidine phosphorylase